MQFFFFGPLFWQPLELICEKAIATCNRPLGAGEALRRVMECLASGILLPGLKTFHIECGVTQCEREGESPFSDNEAPQKSSLGG